MDENCNSRDLRVEKWMVFIFWVISIYPNKLILFRNFEFIFVLIHHIILI
jgi:hypothetical protein